MPLPIIFISGTTAIGKSDLALKVAEMYNGEIINADSIQVYKELNILTSRPSAQDEKLVPHHLYGHISGSERYNVSRWCEEVKNILKKNNKKNKLSIVVGGTGLYIESLLLGLSNIPKIPEKFKKKSHNLFFELGLNSFYSEVYKIDKKSCEKISHNDIQRLKRIWEVYNSTGVPLSEWIKNSKKKYFENSKNKIFVFLPIRKKIYKYVNDRFLKMLNEGAIEEVKKLLNHKLDLSLPIMKAHGVPEISQYLSGLITLEQCIEKGQQVTRNYAKRQITWWKSTKLKNFKIFEDFPINFDSNSLDFLKKIN